MRVVRLLIAVLCLMAPLAFSPATADPPLSPKAFKDKVVANIHTTHPAIAVRDLSDLDIVIASPDHSEGQFSMAVAYQDYLDAPDRLDVIISKLMDGVDLLAGKKDDQNVRDRLVYVLRPAGYLTTPAPDGKAPVSVSRPFGGDLVQLMMIDSPTTMRAAGPHDLKLLGLSEAEAWKVAAKNLARRVGPLLMGDLNGDGPFAVNADSGLATGLLVADCGAEARRKEDGRVVLVLDRNIWISTLPNDPLSVERFWAFAKPLLARHALLSDTPLTCRSGNWETAGPPS